MSEFITDIKTLLWLRKQYYEKAVCSLAENEIKILRSLDEKYAPMDVTQMLIDEIDELQQQLAAEREKSAKLVEALRQIGNKQKYPNGHFCNATESLQSCIDKANFCLKQYGGEGE